MEGDTVGVVSVDHPRQAVQGQRLHAPTICHLQIPLHRRHCHLTASVLVRLG